MQDLIHPCTEQSILAPICNGFLDFKYHQYTDDFSTDNFFIIC